MSGHCAPVWYYSASHKHNQTWNYTNPGAGVNPEDRLVLIRSAYIVQEELAGWLNCFASLAHRSPSSVACS
eukprot:5370843-Prymnesium_polylepis.1